MDSKQMREAAVSLQDMLVARATGGSASDSDYRELRDLFMGSAEFHDLLPSFVRTSRSLDQFWSYIKREAGGYEDRREHVWGAFDPMLRQLEGESDAVPSKPAAAPPVEPIVYKTPQAFISYSTKDKVAAAAVKAALGTVGIDCFMAHDDLLVSEEWRERILEEIAACDLFVPLLSQYFKDSEWAPQEAGAISMRPSVPVVPLSLDGTVPFGFLAKFQGTRVPGSGVDPNTILVPLARRYPRVAMPAMISQVRSAGSFRSAEAAMRPLVPYFDTLTLPEVRALVKASTENGQVWDATLCKREYLPELIKRRRADIPDSELRPLEFQIEQGRWYIPSPEA